mgnify:CR=1 FL=1
MTKMTRTDQKHVETMPKTVERQANERNVGWRIDYFFVSRDLDTRVLDSYILPEIMGSDHCPIILEVGI